MAEAQPDGAIAEQAPPVPARPELRLGLLLLAAMVLVAAVALAVRHELRRRYYESSWEARVVAGAGGSALLVEAVFYAGEARRMRPGQPATVSPDAAPALELAGRVASLAPAPDAPVPFPAPPDATPTRVAVRIAPDDGPEARRLLVPGLPVTARVYTFAGRDG